MEERLHSSLQVERKEGVKMGGSAKNAVWSGYSTNGKKGRGFSQLQVRSSSEKNMLFSAGKIAWLYIAFGTAWAILLNARIEEDGRFCLYSNPLQMGAEIVFVLLTASLVFLVVNRYSDETDASLGLLFHVFDSASVGIVITMEKEQRIAMVNPEFVRMTGYSGRELEGKSDSDIGLWEQAEERFGLIRRLRNNGHIEGYEARFRRRDGRVFNGSVDAHSIEIARQGYTVFFMEDISVQLETARKVEELTRFDPVTGLPNRKLFMETLEQMISISSREGNCLAVLLLVFERCPMAMRTAAEEACEDVSRALAMRLKEAIRETDTVASLEKGEFAILLANIESERNIIPVLGKLTQRISQPLSIGDSEIQLHARIGVSFFPADARTADALLHHSRLAVSQIQERTGNSQFRFYSPEMHQAASEQLQVEASILRGIKLGEFFVCYQPLFDSNGREVRGMEALVRWKHPTLGLVSPDRFIHVAEENGTIVPLGEMVMELALKNCRHWRESGFPDLAVSVNISPRQLQNRQFADRVASLLNTTGVPSSALCCELTESVLMEDSGESAEQIIQLKNMGVSLAIDDFGTGYSSLTYLKHLPVDTIKIDRLFVRDIETNDDDRAIVSAILAMARSLNLKVVGEGVENERQHSILKGMGCNFMQGFHFGRPMERDNFERFLMERPVVSAKISALQDVHPSALPVSAAGTPKQEESAGGRIFEKVSDMTTFIEPLSPSDRLNTVLSRFQTDVSIHVLPVVENRKVIGIINRSQFIEEQIVGRIGYAFHINHSKKARDLMQPVPMVIEAECSIEEAAKSLQGQYQRMRLENICVARNDLYQGLLNVGTLVEAVTFMNLKLARGANPLTGLSGNESIRREIQKKLNSGVPFDIAYIDIDNFKPFNDHYGFERGDLVISIVGDVLKSIESGENFCGHIGGDDFIIITHSGRGIGLSERLLSEFAVYLPRLHGDVDFSRGEYSSTNRKGEQETFCLLSLSIALINTRDLGISSYPQLASLASEVKKTAKMVKGPSIALRDFEGVRQMKAE